MSTTAGWRVPINVKLLAVLAVPVVGYLVIASAAVVRAQVHANRIRDQASVVSTAVGPTSLTTSLIDERTITDLEADGLQDELTLRIGTLAEARRATDEQLASLERLVGSNDAASVTYTGAVEGLADELAALRSEVDGGTADSTATFDRYGEFITALLDANAAAVEDVSDAEFWQGAKLSELATRQKDARAVLVNALIPVSLNTDGLTENDQAVAIIRALSAYENRDGAISELASGQYAQPGSVLVEALDAADLAGLARTTLETDRLDSAQLFDVASYKGGFVYDAPTGDYIHDWFRAQVVEILDQNSGERMAAADRRLRDHAVGATIGLLITAVITFLVSRSIIRPLRSLTAHVIGTATEGLPAAVRQIQETPLGEDVPWPALRPVGVATADEVGDVAEAFTTMQQSALDLAVEEAMLRRHITDSLVTLGQRNQSLLARQLTFITDLERNETDPDTLADLFYLDHLAVRMRRNAELLLVLAGVDPPRKWVGPTPVADTIRAALGEAAEYKRVRVHDVEHATIAGSATVELSHLLAELVENALVYSPPGDIVSISARHRPGPGGADDFYVITVQDSGVGMTPEDMEQANRRLSSAESHSIAPSKYMGHYIAGKLAARHGIVARLHPNPAGAGVLATVAVPAHLLTFESHPDTVTQLPPLPPLPVHITLPDDAPRSTARSGRAGRSDRAGRSGRSAGADPPTTAEEPVMPLPPALPLEPLPALVPLPPLPPDDAADRPDQPAAPSGRPGRDDDPAEVPTAEMVEIDLPGSAEPMLDDYDDADDYDDQLDPSAPVPLKKQQPPAPRGRRRPLPSNRLPIPPRTEELSIAEDSDTAS